MSYNWVSEARLLYYTQKLKAKLLELIPAIDDTSTTATDKTWSAKKIYDEISSITGFDFKKVTELPETGEKGIIYLVPQSKTSTQNIYDEYIWITADSAFEKIGSTEIDLSGYVKADDMVEITTDQIDTIFTTVWPTS